MATFADIGISQPAASTTTMKAGTVIVTRNSTAQHQGLMTLADPETTNAIGRVTDTEPASTMFGQVVRQVGYSTTVQISSIVGPVNVRSSAANALVTVYQSSQAELRATIYQSTFADLEVRVNAPSTANAENFLPVRFSDGSTWVSPGAEYTDGSTTSTLAAPALAFNNSSNDTMRLVGSAQPLPTHLRTSSGTVIAASTISPAANDWGLAVRQVRPTLLSTTIVVTSSNSTALYELLSSAAGVKHKVFAYSLTSTSVVPSTFIFMSSGAQGDKWGVAFGSGSSGVSGANLAIAPPGFLFETATANALNAVIESGSTGQSARLSISYFTEA